MRERLRHHGRVFAAAASSIRLSSALATDNWCDSLNDLSRLNPRGEFRRDRCDKGDGIVRGSGKKTNTREFPLERIGDGLKIISINGTKIYRKERNLPDRFRMSDKFFGACGRLAGAGGFEGFFQFLVMGQHRLDLLLDLSNRAVELCSD